jgi:hypothetical protein
VVEELVGKGGGPLADARGPETCAAQKPGRVFFYSTLLGAAKDKGTLK